MEKHATEELVGINETGVFSIGGFVSFFIAISGIEVLQLVRRAVTRRNNKRNNRWRRNFIGLHFPFKLYSFIR
jgi:uncharacterized BrkB/YihY/UPF0761 family membrane protein